MPTSYIKKLAKGNKKRIKKLEKYWDKAKELAKKKFEEGSDEFWAYTTGIFKRMAKVKSEAIVMAMLASESKLYDKITTKLDRVMKKSTMQSGNSARFYLNTDKISIVKKLYSLIDKTKGLTLSSRYKVQMDKTSQFEAKWEGEDLNDISILVAFSFNKDQHGVYHINVTVYAKGLPATELPNEITSALYSDDPEEVWQKINKELSKITHPVMKAGNSYLYMIRLKNLKKINEVVRKIEKLPKKYNFTLKGYVDVNNRNTIKLFNSKSATLKDKFEDSISIKRTLSYERRKFNVRGYIIKITISNNVSYDKNNKEIDAIIKVKTQIIQEVSKRIRVL